MASTAHPPPLFAWGFPPRDTLHYTTHFPSHPFAPLSITAATPTHPLLNPFTHLCGRAVCQVPGHPRGQPHHERQRLEQHLRGFFLVRQQPLAHLDKGVGRRVSRHVERDSAET